MKKEVSQSFKSRSTSISKLITEAISRDLIIDVLKEKKAELVGLMTPKYIVDTKTNTAKPVYNKADTDVLKKIDLLVEHRIEQIKDHFTKNKTI
jgi:hypothetical protein